MSVAPELMKVPGTQNGDHRHQLLGKDIEYGLSRTEARLKKIDSRLAKLEGRKEPLIKKELETPRQKKVNSKMSFAQYNSFLKNLGLSMRTALFVTIFGLPTYADYFIEIAFGNPAEKTLCDINIGRMYKVADASKKSGWTLEKWNYQEPEWTATGNQVQCGYLPDIYKAYWPTVGMMIIFTVFQNLGQTMRLAWQGFVGTFWAVANSAVLCCICPKGAMSENYMPWLAWFNLAFILIAYLMSNSDTNTIKLGLSTHVCLMLEFMNPNTGPSSGQLPSFIPGVNWDNEGVCWLLTTMVGISIAVVATLVPVPLLNLTEVDDICIGYCERSARIFESTIDYICGQEMSPEGDQIAARILKCSNNLASMAAQNSAAWWECLGLGKGGRKVQAYMHYEDALQHMQGVLVSIRRSVMCEDFEGCHSAFFTRPLHQAMHGLSASIKDLAVRSAQICEDGSIDDEEKEELKVLHEKLVHSQKHLLGTYITETKKVKEQTRGVNIELGFEHTIMFGLCNWGRRINYFVNNSLLNFEMKKPSMMDHVNQAKRQIIETWDPKDLWTKERIVYTARNTFAILICYWMAMNIKDGTSLFDEYSSVMPVTLTLLINRHPGTTFFSSTQRLIGVTMGKVIPLLALGVINITECGVTNTIYHSIAVFLYMTLFLYMYFTSLQYSSIGCFAAAYGCSFLFVPCQNSNFEDTYAARYKELGQIVCAIVVQQIMDFTFELYNRSEEPRRKAVVAVKLVQEKVSKAYTSFFNVDQLLRDDYEGIMKAIAQAEIWVEEGDPALEVCPGLQTPFNKDLYGEAVKIFKTLASDFYLLGNAVGAVQKHKKKSQHEGTLDSIYQFNEKPTLKKVQKCLLGRINDAFRALVVLLEHDSGAPIQDAFLSKITFGNDLNELDGIKEFVDEINADFSLEEREEEERSKRDLTEIMNMRLHVAIQALVSANETLADLMDLIAEHNQN